MFFEVPPDPEGQDKGLTLKNNFLHVQQIWANNSKNRSKNSKTRSKNWAISLPIWWGSGWVRPRFHGFPRKTNILAPELLTPHFWCFCSRFGSPWLYSEFPDMFPAQNFKTNLSRGTLKPLEDLKKTGFCIHKNKDRVFLGKKTPLRGMLPPKPLALKKTKHSLTSQA